MWTYTFDTQLFGQFEIPLNEVQPKSGGMPKPQRNITIESQTVGCSSHIMIREFPNPKKVQKQLAVLPVPKFSVSKHFFQKWSDFCSAFLKLRGLI